MKTSCKFILIVLFTVFSALTVHVSDSTAGKNSTLNRAVSEAKEAGVTESQLNRVLLLSHKKELEPEETAALLEALSRVREKGVPLSPFISKMEEGLTKRVPVAIIKRVLDKKLDDFVFVRDLMQPILDKADKGRDFAPELLERLSASLAYGITREEISNLARQTSPASLPALVRGVEIMASLRQKQFKSRFDPKHRARRAHPGPLHARMVHVSEGGPVGQETGPLRKGIADATMNTIKKGRLHAAAYAVIGARFPRFSGRRFRTDRCCIWTRRSSRSRSGAWSAGSRNVTGKRDGCTRYRPRNRSCRRRPRWSGSRSGPRGRSGRRPRSRSWSGSRGRSGRWPGSGTRCRTRGGAGGRPWRRSGWRSRSGTGRTRGRRSRCRRGIGVQSLKRIPRTKFVYPLKYPFHFHILDSHCNFSLSKSENLLKSL